MDTRSRNPFLADDHSAIQDTTMFQPASNPFLEAFNESPSTSTSMGENPFLSFSEDLSYNQAMNSTNPFSSFTISSAELTSEVENTPTSNILKNDFNSSFTNIFGDETKQMEEIFSSSFANSEKCAKSLNDGTFVVSRHTKTALSPPPRNTKDLILSVTGAMDATSSQMLNRLQNTKTPSPTLLHSPSPTPEHSLADLLDIENDVTDISKNGKQIYEDKKSLDVISLFEETTSVSMLNPTSRSNILPTDISYNALEMQENTFTAIESVTLVDHHIDILYTGENLPSAQLLSTKDLPTGTSNLFAGMHNYKHN